MEWAVWAEWICTNSWINTYYKRAVRNGSSFFNIFAIEPCKINKSFYKILLKEKNKKFIKKFDYLLLRIIRVKVNKNIYKNWIKDKVAKEIEKIIEY